MLLGPLIQELLLQGKEFLAQKLAPKKQESPESKALNDIRVFLEGLSARYGQEIPVSSVYDQISHILTPFSDEPIEFTQKTPMWVLPQIVLSYAARFMPVNWAPEAPLFATGFWYSSYLTHGKEFTAVPYYAPAKPGDILVTDSRYAQGNGVIGLITHDDGDYVTFLTNSDMDSGPVVRYRAQKNSCLGYLRPNTHPKTKKDQK